MLKKILMVLLVALIAFAFYVQSRPNHFTFERSGLIHAKPEKIFPYLNSFKLGSEWTPYERIDPQMKKTYSTVDSGVGASLDFSGNQNIGEGRIEIVKSEPLSLVELKLEMKRPMAGTNFIQYKLTPETDGTRFSWSMNGEANFLSKLMGILLNCEKMMGEQFDQGIQNLKTIVETQPKSK
jgi:hypothetical protein